MGMTKISVIGATNLAGQLLKMFSITQTTGARFSFWKHLLKFAISPKFTSKYWLFSCAFVLAISLERCVFDGFPHPCIVTLYCSLKHSLECCLSAIFCAPWLVGDMKEPTHLAKRVRHVVPGVVVWPSLTGWWVT